MLRVKYLGPVCSELSKMIKVRHKNDVMFGYVAYTVSQLLSKFIASKSPMGEKQKNISKKNWKAVDEFLHPGGRVRVRHVSSVSISRKWAC